jgi:glutathione peroxidase
MLIRVSGKKATILKNLLMVTPAKSIYKIPILLNNGSVLQWEDLKGKKLLLVNTASDCGYTAQYKELQQLQDEYTNHLLIIAFPSNDFKEQEKGNDETILKFCQVNFGVNFPLTKKCRVLKDAGQHPVYQWLTNKNRNGWNEQEPKWNFCKYLINEEGILTHYFDAAISPLSDEMKEAIFH